MSDPPDNPSTPERLAERLVDVAGEIFAEKGPSATVREICKKAGCSIAAINYYFGDKSQLYIRCVETACQRKMARFPLPEDLAGHDPSELLRVFLRTIASRIGSKANVSWHNTLMLREVISPSAGVAQLLQKPFLADVGLLEKLLSQLLGPKLDSRERRQELVTQIIARCMFFRTGKNIRAMLGLDTPVNEEPESYADVICDSMLAQIHSLQNSSSSQSVGYSSDDNKTTNPTSIES